MKALISLEKLALELPEPQRATLALHILDSLPALFAEPDNGLAEAKRRDSELDANPSMGISPSAFDKRIKNRRPR
jgi:hypothetical protein